MDAPTRRPPTDEFREAGLPTDAPAALRPALLAGTTRVLRRRRWRRRAGGAAAAAACYLAGVLTMQFAAPAGAPPRPESAHQPSPPALPEPPAVVAGAVVPEDDSALALEWRAFESVERRAELYRRAGDRYLGLEGDMQSALRCYRQALDANPEASWMISPTDNWLLVALKEARQKEKSHARNGS